MHLYLYLSSTHYLFNPHNVLLFHYASTMISISHHYQAIHARLHWSPGAGCVTFRSGLDLTSRCEETHDRPLRFYYSRAAVQTSWRFADFRCGRSLKTTSDTSRPRLYWPQSANGLRGFKGKTWRLKKKKKRKKNSNSEKSSKSFCYLKSSTGM